MFGLKQVIKSSGFLLAAVLLSLNWHSVAEAQVLPESRPSVSVISTATGTIVAAALESAGYAGHALVLDQLGGMLSGLGALILIGVVVSALMTTALMGKYDMAMWILVGPTLFFVLTRTTTPATGAEWQYAGTIVEEAAGTGKEGAPEVSWVFHQYNVLVSNFIQNMINIVTNEAIMDKTRKFTNRQRILEDLLSDRVKDSSLLNLSTFALQQCHNEMSDARKVAQGRGNAGYKNTPEYHAALSGLKKSYSTPKISLDQVHRTYLKELLQTHSTTAASTSTTSAKEPTVINHCLRKQLSDRGMNAPLSSDNLNTMVGNPVSCEDLWCWMGLGVQQEVIDTLMTSTEANVGKSEPDGPVTEADKDVYQKIWQELAIKLSKPEDLPDQYGNPIDRMNADVSVIPVVIGGYLTRKLLTADPRSTGMPYFAGKSGFEVQPYKFNFDVSEEQLQEVQRRQNQHTQAEGQKYEVFILSMMLPYAQGLFLYGLGVIFPFFALMVIIPGKAAEFFTWMTLWLWIKSWDLGWAFVMVIDDVLWSLMPHDSFYNPIKDPNGVAQGPVDAFEAAFQGDPAYSLSAYYILIGSLITGVPVITAQMILGGKQAVGGMLLDGFKDMASKLGGAAADYAAVQQAGNMNWLRDTALINKATNAVASGKASSNIPGLAQFQATSETMKSRGDFAKGLGTAGLTLGLGTAAVGVLAAAAGIAAAPVIAAGAGIAAAGYGIHAAGLNINRAVSKRNTEFRNANAAGHIYSFKDSKEYFVTNATRAGGTKRKEWMNVKDVPQGAVTGINQGNVNVAAEMAYLQTKGLFSAAGAPLQLLTRPVMAAASSFAPTNSTVAP